MDFLHQPDIKAKYGIERNIGIRTARQYLNALGYRYRAAPKGQYVDGHERADVVNYCEKVFYQSGTGFNKGWQDGTRN